MSIDQAGRDAAQWLRDEVGELGLPSLDGAARRSRRRKAALATFAAVVLIAGAGGYLLQDHQAPTQVVAVSRPGGPPDRFVPSYVPAGWTLNAAYSNPDSGSLTTISERLYAAAANTKTVASAVEVATYRYDTGTMAPTTMAPTTQPTINGHPAQWFSSAGVRSVQWMYNQRTQVAVRARHLSDAQLTAIAQGATLDITGMAAADRGLPSGDHLIAQNEGGRLGPPGWVVGYANAAETASVSVASETDGAAPVLIERWSFPQAKPVTVRGHPGLFVQFSDLPSTPPPSASAQTATRRPTFTELIWQERSDETVLIGSGGTVAQQTLLKMADSLQNADDATWSAVQAQAHACRTEGNGTSCPPH